MPDEWWPPLAEIYGLHPRDARLPPEQGGLTHGQLRAFVDHYQARTTDPPFLGVVALAELSN